MSEVTDVRKKRSLILAGGGMKVAFQAGVLQVWLDEARIDGAPITFDHADGASGGTFNLAMYCQGLSGTEIAKNWRDLDPLKGIDINWDQFANPYNAEAIFELDRFKKNIFQEQWDLDWDKICSSQKEATFNVYNFSKHELEVLGPHDMTEEYLAACVSLPMWFPPVIIGTDAYIDAVFVTDANVEEAIARGADELWIIWTVSERGEWNDGFVANYFQIIEAAANGHLKRTLKRIDDNNAAFENEKSGEFGRHIETKILRAEVPLHYLINLSSDRIKEAVNRGVRAAREWCVERGILLESPGEQPPKNPVGLCFTEEMKGYVSFDEPNSGRDLSNGREDHTLLTLHLTIKVDDVDNFVTDPGHEALAEGVVKCEAFGGELPVERGWFNLFEDSEDQGKRDPSRKRMLYRLHFYDERGQPLTLCGCKKIEDDPGADLWRDTTTLFTRIVEGHVDFQDDAEVVASGVVRVHMLDFLEQLTTFQVKGTTAVGKASALTRFGKLFFGHLWDVYARRVLSSSPF